jgi:hypothetical protein
MQDFIEKLPIILAVLLGISEALAHIPSLKSNSILELLTSAFRKAKPIADKLAEDQAKKMEEAKKEEEKAE